MFGLQLRHFITVGLIALLGILQYQTWLGRGNANEVQTMQQTLADLQHKNQKQEAANERMRSEIRDLKEGLSTVEERARYELGMVKPNEIFVQITH